MSERFQVVTLRVPFDPGRTTAPSTWAWGNLPIHATLLDADPVSEDPDVQPLYSRSSWQHEVEVCRDPEGNGPGHLFIEGEDR